MATINDFIGFETLGLEEATSTGGSPTIDTTLQASGAAALFTTSQADLYRIGSFDHVADAGNSYVVGCRIRIGGTPVDASVIIRDDNNGPIVGVEFRANGVARLTGLLGATLGDSATNIIKLNNWHYIEIWFEHLDPADAKLFVDGVEVVSVSAVDLVGLGTDLLNCTLGGEADDQWFDDFYFMSGATGSGDRLGPVEVYMKQGAQAGTTPDTSDLADTVLDEGTWQGASETPLDEETQTAAASYTEGAAAGVVYANGSGDKLGPAGDDRFTGVTIVAMKGFWRMARSGGGGTAQFGEIGNDGGAASDIETTADLDITASFANYGFLTETAATFPALTEHAAIGFSKDGGGQDLDVAEMWVMFLVVPNAPNVTDLADAEWPDQNYHVGPFEI